MAASKSSAGWNAISAHISVTVPHRLVMVSPRDALSARSRAISAVYAPTRATDTESPMASNAGCGVGDGTAGWEGGLEGKG